MNNNLKPDVDQLIRLSLLHHYGDDSIYCKYYDRLNLFNEDSNILSLPEYSNVVKLLSHFKNWTIVDIGCGVGCQQLLFEGFEKYIGIDLFVQPETVAYNVEMWHGDCKDIIPHIVPKGNGMVAVSLHAGAYYKDVQDIIKQYFSHIIML